MGNSRQGQLRGDFGHSTFRKPCIPLSLGKSMYLDQIYEVFRVYDPQIKADKRRLTQWIRGKWHLRTSRMITSLVLPHVYSTLIVFNLL